MGYCHTVRVSLLTVGQICLHSPSFSWHSSPYIEHLPIKQLIFFPKLGLCLDMTHYVFNCVWVSIQRKPVWAVCLIIFFLKISSTPRRKIKAKICIRVYFFPHYRCDSSANVNNKKKCVGKAVVFKTFILIYNLTSIIVMIISCSQCLVCSSHLAYCSFAAPVA